MSHPFCINACWVVFFSLFITVPATTNTAAAGQDFASQPDAADREIASSSDINLTPTQTAGSQPKTTLNNRLLLTGTLIVIVLGQLSVLFGYLRIDHATRGFYSGRLQSIAAVASIAIFAAGYLFYTSWMS